ncbi:MAG: cytochrome b561 [Halioglobus sp.]|jgi:cytochrome b561
MKNPIDYSKAQKIVHWLMAIMLILDLFIAQKFGDVMEDFDRLDSRIDHGSMGAIVGVLLIIRIALRLKHGAPQLPASMTAWQIKAAKLGHGLLYFLISFLVLSGLLTTANAASPVALFGVLDITIGQINEDKFQSIRVFHEYATNTLIALIVVHVLAAVYHWLIVKDQIMQRMLRFWRTYSE